MLQPLATCSTSGRLSVDRSTLCQLLQLQATSRNQGGSLFSNRKSVQLHRKVSVVVCSLSEGPGEGDPKVQETLVDIIRLQVSQENVKEMAEEERDKLRLLAEQAKMELDKMEELSKSQSDLAFGSAMADINLMAEASLEQLKKSRVDVEKEDKEFQEWEENMVKSRNQFTFFKSLYSVTKPSDEVPVTDEVQAEIDGVKKVAVEQMGSPARVWTFAFLAGILAAGVLADILSGSPSVVQDVLYGTLCMLLGLTAWQEKERLVPDKGS